MYGIGRANRLANLAAAQEMTITPDPEVLTAAVEVEHDSETNF